MVQATANMRYVARVPNAFIMQPPIRPPEPLPATHSSVTQEGTADKISYLRDKTVFPKPACLVTHAILWDVVDTSGSSAIIVKYGCFNVG